MILKLGVSYDLVKQLKVLLNARGARLTPTNPLFGDLTNEAVRNFQLLNKLDVDGEVDTEFKGGTWDALNGPPPALVTVGSLHPLLAIVTVAASFLGVREVSENRSPDIAKFWADNDLGPQGMIDREPWCCAFATYCVRRADEQSTLFNLKSPPTMASVALFDDWARDPANECLVFRPVDVVHRQPLAGDIVSFRPNLSHIGIVAEDYDGTGFVQTIEGNTNGQGAREGDGVYRKQRRLNFCGSFVRLPASMKA